MTTKLTKTQEYAEFWTKQSNVELLYELKAQALLLEKWRKEPETEHILECLSIVESEILRRMAFHPGRNNILVELKD